MSSLRAWLRQLAQSQQFPTTTRNGELVPNYSEIVARYIEENHGGAVTANMVRTSQFPNPSSLQRIIADEFQRYVA